MCRQRRLATLAKAATAKSRRPSRGSQHRRHVGLNHSRALAASENADSFPPMRQFAAAHFGRVVRGHDRPRELRRRLQLHRFACGPSLAPPSESSRRAAARQSRRLSTPESAKDSSAPTPATPFKTASEAAYPSEPVQQFALPELTTKARMFPARPPQRVLRRRTGAACTPLVVNIAVAVAGVSLTRARIRPDSSNPQAAQANEKPLGVAPSRWASCCRNRNGRISQNRQSDVFGNHGGDHRDQLAGCCLGTRGDPVHSFSQGCAATLLKTRTNNWRTRYSENASYLERRVRERKLKQRRRSGSTADELFRQICT